MFENRARYLADPEHRGVVRGDLDGDQDLLQTSEGVRFDEEAQRDITGTFSGYRERDEERGVCFGQ
jgi:hypothetical protein